MSTGEISNMSKNAGFTIVELLITIAIGGILMAFAIPNFIAWRANSKLIGVSQNLRGDLEMAKKRAIRENASVEVLFDPDNNGAVSNRYEIFIYNGTTPDNWSRDSDETLLRNRQLEAGITIDLAATTFVNDGTRFDGRGIPIPPAGTVVIAGSTGARKIVMNRLGRLKVQ